MKFYVMTLFPEMIKDMASVSILKRAAEAGHLEIIPYNIRDYAGNKHARVDDYPFGGGPGMLMQAEPVYQCYKAICADAGAALPVIYMTPQGRTFTQAVAGELSELTDMILLCGHYEGIDERVIEKIVTDEISIGDYVLTGGELAAMVVIDAVSRLIPGVLHNEESAVGESFTEGLLEYPQYTRPAVWEGMEVPEVLLCGDPKKVNAWKAERALERTRTKRPDLLK